MLGIGHDDVEDERAVVIEHLLDGCLEFAFFVDAATLHAEAFGDFYEIWIQAGEVVGTADIGLVAEDGVASDAAVEAIFPLDDHAEVLIIEDHRFCGDLLDVAGGELLDVHDERAVAINVDDLFVGAGDLCAHRCGVAEAHGAETERADESARFIEAIELRSPHLMLANARRDNRVALGEFVEGGDGFLGHDVLALFETKGVVFLPRRDLRVPR